MVDKVKVSELKLKKKYLYKFMKHARAFLKEIKIDFTEEGMEMISVEPAHVGMVEETLYKSAFEKYEEDTISLGVNIEKIQEFLKSFDYDDLVTMEIYKDADYNKQPFIKMTASRDLYTLSDTKMGLDPAGMEKTSLPSLELLTEFETSNEALRVMVDHIKNIDDTLFMIYDDGEVELYAEEDREDTKMKLQEIEFIEQPEDKRRLESMIARGYISDVVNTIRKKKDVKISLGNDYPVRFEAGFEDGKGEVKYLIAPRLKNR